MLGQTRRFGAALATDVGPSDPALQLPLSLSSFAFVSPRRSYAFQIADMEVFGMMIRATLAAVTGRRASWVGLAAALFLLVGLAPPPAEAQSVNVSATVDGDAAPDAVLTATVTIEILDGSGPPTVAWTQTGFVPAQIVGGDTTTPTVTLPDSSTYKAGLVHALTEPPIAEEDFPPNVELPEEGFVGGLQDRFQVVGINPFALEETALLMLHVDVTTSSGVYSDEVEVHVALPWKVTRGTPNVPVGIAVLLHGKDHLNGGGPYDWTLDLAGASGSSATLEDATSQDPWFVPDVQGTYILTVSDVDPMATDPVTIEVDAGRWIGAITGQDMDGFPVAGDCDGCHNDFWAPDKFTPWSMTGHAEIFTNNLNESPYWGEGCFPCHTVGFDPDVDNGGIDDADDYGDFLAAGLIGNPNADNWTTVLNEYPDTARFANIQCENCHGPMWGSHDGERSLLLSADVCASCHGEPLRHARFQQWQLSRHANYALAVDMGGSGNCSRCHTGNGFLAWLPVLLGDEPGDPLDNVEVTWTADETHPQTCATCHDPHAIGTTTGVDNNATVRISGDTPPLIAGFTATDVGRGAICMTCHNTRRGARNDDTFAETSTTDPARVPHGGAQADMLMGQNAYLVAVGARGGHSKTEGSLSVPDTCATCHMEKTPPPDLLSHNQGGTNHTFFASPDICGTCHFGSLTAKFVQDPVEDMLNQLQGLQEDAILDLITALTGLGLIIDLDEEAQITDAAEVQEIVFGEYRGRQSITVTLPGGTFGPIRMNDVGVIADGTPIGELYDFADPRVIKAGWNWNLVHNDGTLGVHNPVFTFNVLDASVEALQMVPEPGGLASALAAVSTVAWLAHRSRRRSRGRSPGA